MGCGASFARESPDVPPPTPSNDGPIPEAVLITEADAVGVQDETVPEYWTNKKHADQMQFSQMVYVSQEYELNFEEMMAQSYEAKSTRDRPCPKKDKPCDRMAQGCPCVRVDGEPGLPTGFRVRRVVRVENSKMWEKYAQKRKAIFENRSGETLHKFTPPLKTMGVFDVSTFEKLNEVYLWHGTRLRTALSIAQKDFDMGMAGTGRGAMYGPGAYFAESSTKADEYAFDEPGGYYDGIHAMLLCRVCMGKMYYTTKFGQEDAIEKVKGGAFDSVLADLNKSRKTFREFVIYDADQIYPEYVILYQRIHKADDPKRIWEIAATPFHLELPVYWRNCHREPKSDRFHEQCELKSTTRDLLQRLVSACTWRREVMVKSARRIENAYLHNNYVAFKAYVRRYLTGDVPQPAISISSRCISITEVAKCETNADTSVATARFLSQEGDFYEESLSVDNLDLPLNEHLLWYGASKEEVDAMATNGLDITRGGNNPAFQRYGRGLYFSDTIDVGLDYAEKDDDGVKHILLCRVCCGEVYYTEQDELSTADTEARSARKHSVLAKPADGGPREFIMLENTQAYPEFALQVMVADE